MMMMRVVIGIIPIPHTRIVGITPVVVPIVGIISKTPMMSEIPVPAVAIW
jgi:hypothetical protein